MKRLSLFVLAVLMLGTLFTACQPAAPTTAKVGMNVELTGSIPVVGESSKNAAELAVKEINDAGGLDVGGTKYTVELLVEDNEDRAESAAAAAQKLATAGVVAMIGPNASRNAIPASVVAESSLMPMISPWSTNPKTTKVGDTDEPKKFVFRAAFIDDFQGVVAAKFAKDELKTTKPAVLYDVASEYNKGIAEVYKKRLEDNGIPVVVFETYTTGDKDFSAQLTKMNSTSTATAQATSEVTLKKETLSPVSVSVCVQISTAWSAAASMPSPMASARGGRRASGGPNRRRPISRPLAK